MEPTLSETTTQADTAPAVATETTHTPVVPDATQAPAVGETLLATEAPASDSPETPEAEIKPDADVGAPDYSGLKLPEGADAEAGVFADFKAVAAEHGLKPEAAQALIDKVLPGIAKQIADLQAEPVRLASERLSEWTQAVMADPEIGGAKLATVKTTVAGAMEQFGNPDEIKAALNETGAGSNPVLIRWLSRMASALSEGTSVKSGGVPGKKSGPEVFYDHPNSQPRQDAAQ